VSVRVKINRMDGEPTVAQIGIADLPAQFGQTAVLLDVREDDEWARGHAAHAQHIPMGEVPARIDEISRSATLYVVCKLGGQGLRVPRSQRVRTHQCQGWDVGLGRGRPSSRHRRRQSRQRLGRRRRRER